MLLPNLFGKLKTTAPAREPNAFGKAKYSVSGARTVTNAGQALNFSSIGNVLSSKLKLFNGALKSSGASETVNNLNRSAEIDAAVIDQPATRAVSSLEKRGLKVRVASFDSAQASASPNFSAILRQPKANEEVVLHEKDGRVAYYTVETVAAPASPAAGSNTGATPGTPAASAVSQADLQSLRDALAARDTEIASLRVSLQAQTTQLQSLTAISSRMQILESALLQQQPQGGLSINTNVASGATGGTRANPQETLNLLRDAAPAASAATPAAAPAKAASASTAKTAAIGKTATAKTTKAATPSKPKTKGGKG